MEYVLITLNVSGRDEDLRVPALIAAGELVDVFNELYEASGAMLHCEPKGIILDTGKTLAEQGVGHGARLTLR
ncbi:MAG: EsaB/YukD family protein [Clostridiales Family XIII bacterium]|nr:EsaB/YukD family protein [Clostridiales Family XIII bacterium]